MSETIKYHCEKAKKGAVDSKGNALSDFERGKHSAKAERLINKRNTFLQEQGIEALKSKSNSAPKPAPKKRG